MPEVGNGGRPLNSSEPKRKVSSRCIITVLLLSVLFWVAKSSFKKEAVSIQVVSSQSETPPPAAPVSSSSSKNTTTATSAPSTPSTDKPAGEASVPVTEVSTQSPSAGTWLEDVKWEDLTAVTDPKDFLSRFRSKEKVTVAQHEISYPNGVVKMEPTCLEQGVGWISHGVSLLTVPVDLEIHRKHSPVAKQSPFQAHMLSSDSEWAYVGLVASYNIDTLFHLIWAHLVIYRAFFKLQDIHKSNGTLFINPWSGGKQHLREKPDLFTGMYAALGEMFPSSDFGGELGEIVCFKNGYMGGEKVYKTARGSISTVNEAPGHRLAQLLFSRFKIGDIQFRQSPNTYRSNQRILLVERKVRRIVNLPEVRDWCREEGLLCASGYLEMMKLSEQFAAISYSDIIIQIHGSSMSWMMFSYPNWKVWIEILPNAGGSSSKIYSPDNMIVANSGKGTYGLLQRVTHTNYMGWLERNVSNAISSQSCKKTNHGTGRPEFWKLCSVRLDNTIFKALVAAALKYKMNKIPNGKLEFFLPTLNLDDVAPLPK